MSAATKKATAKKSPVKKQAAKTEAKAPAKVVKKTAEEAPKKQYQQRWSIGLFRNQHGGLSTVYVTLDGVPMPYEAVRVGKSKILFHAQYIGMLYREARQQLLKDAAKAGIKDEPKEESKPTAKAAKTTPKTAETPRKPRSPVKSSPKTKGTETVKD
jgi:hypothetical protein